MNVNEKSSAIASGGSALSRSVTSSATIVAMHDSFATRSTAGSRTKVVGPPLTDAACGPLVSHVMVNHDPATATGSLNVTSRFAFGWTSPSPSLGVVAATLGASSGGATVVNETITSFAMASGGSFVSWSVTCEWRMARLHPSPVAKSVVGLIVKVVGPPVTAAGCAPLVSHASSNHASARSTGSLKVTSRFESTATSAALSAGVVDVTAAPRREELPW